MIGRIKPTEIAMEPIVVQPEIIFRDKVEPDINEYDIYKLNLDSMA